jgi:hypothetical protein
MAVFTLPPEHGAPWRGLFDTASEDGWADGVVPAGAPCSLILLGGDGDAVTVQPS